MVNNVTTNVNPTISVSGGSVSTTSSASASVTNEISVDNTISAIRESDLNQETKDDAEAAVTELGQAAKNKDTTRFLVVLEKIASIAKSTSTLGRIVLPLIGSLISRYFLGIQ